MELENANLKEEHMTMQKKLENKMQIEKRQTLQMEETCKEQMQFGKRHIWQMKNTWKEPLQVGRGRHDMWRIEADEMQPGEQGKMPNAARMDTTN